MNDKEKDQPNIYQGEPAHTYENVVYVGQTLKELFVSERSYKAKKPPKPKSRRRWPK